MTTDGTIPAGVTDATNVFNGNVATIPGYAGLSVQASPTPTVTKTGIKLASKVSFSCQGSGHLPEGHRIHHPHGDRQFDIERFAAALSGFLPDAGRFRLDGPAVDDDAKPCGCRASTRTTMSNTRPAARWPAISPRKRARASIRPSRPRPTPQTNPPTNTNLYPAVQYEQLLHGLCVFPRQSVRALHPHQHGLDQERAEAGSRLPDVDDFRPAGSLNTDPKWGLPRGFILPHRGHRRLHPVAPRRGRLRREPIADDRQQQGNHQQSIPDRALSLHPEYRLRIMLR